MRKILLGLVLFLSGCSVSKETAITVLQAHGFVPVELAEGADLLSCGPGEPISRGFIAKNAYGEEIQGTICCGLLFTKCTLRF